MMHLAFLWVTFLVFIVFLIPILNGSFSMNMKNIEDKILAIAVVFYISIDVLNEILVTINNLK